MKRIILSATFLLAFVLFYNLLFSFDYYGIDRNTKDKAIDADSLEGRISDLESRMDNLENGIDDLRRLEDPIRPASFCG